MVVDFVATSFDTILKYIIFFLFYNFMSFVRKIEL